MHLLDANVLIARADSQHPSHQLAVRWMREHSAGRATCPITENGTLRILGHANFPGNGAGSRIDTAVILEGMIFAFPGHRFIPDDFSGREISGDHTNVTSESQANIYLLSLAVRPGIRFLSLDQPIDPTLVRSGSDSLKLLK